MTKLISTKGTGAQTLQSSKSLFSPTFSAIAVLLPTVLSVGLFVYGFITWTGVISFTNSKFAPEYNFVGLSQYVKLWSNERWTASVVNLSIFATLFIGLTLLTGLVLAILLDQRIRAENVIRTIYLYPMAISFIVTGIAWKWLLAPDLGIRGASELFAQRHISVAPVIERSNAARHVRPPIGQESP